MPPPTNPIISRSGPQAVIYDLTSPTETTITLPPHSQWTSGLHWHESHTEFLRLVRGRIWVRLDNHVQILSAALEGKRVELEVKIGVRHEWRRADYEDSDEDVVVIESTHPADGEKSVFFWNLNEVILAAGRRKPGTSLGTWLAEWWLMVQLFHIFRVLDNWPVLLHLSGMGGFGKSIEWTVTHAILRIAGMMAWLSGYEAVSKERMPEELWESWMGKEGQGKRA